MEKYKLPQWYVSTRKRIEHNLTLENFQGIDGKFPSPCGNYVFVVEKYQKAVKDWIYTYYRGIIYSLQNHKEVTTVSSDAYKFWYCWVKQGENLYLICNEDPQGYTIIDVKKELVFRYIDPKAREGWGFSWKEVSPSPDGKFLAVQGDYMESNREVALYDLSDFNPPLRKIKRLDANLKSGYLVLLGWKDGKVVMEHHQPHKETTTVEVGV